VENAKNSKNEIEKTKTNAENTLEIIKTLLVDAQQKIQNMQSAYEEFVEIRAKIEDSNT
jgi:uncharacterized coiled-coil DUF342 family protein